MIFSVAITGPTASGKTALSLSLAKALDAEIISSDSMQIYKGMDIGTAKATAEERSMVKHHMIDFLSPRENYSVESYRSSALQCAVDITSRGKLPLFVGGTGLYIDSLTRAGALNIPESDPEYRERILAGIRSDEDILRLWQRLAEVDAESAEKIHRNNIKRVIRALEIYEKTGKPKSQLDKESKATSPDISVGMITLDFHNRDILYSRIDKRVDIMISDGLVSEVESLWRGGELVADTTAAQAIGYKEIIEHLRGECTLAEAIEKIKLSSRRYAKRQLTWFRHEAGAKVIFVDGEDGAMRDGAAIFDEAMDAVDRFRKGIAFNEG